MRRVILDTNFILSCIRQKIDFFEEIPLLGLQIIIPEQIIKELKKIIDSKKKLHFKEEAKIALKLLEKNNFKKIDLKRKNVDTGIITLAKSDKNIIIATLDKEIKTKIKNQELIIRGKKKLEIV